MPVVVQALRDFSGDKKMVNAGVIALHKIIDLHADT